MMAISKPLIASVFISFLVLLHLFEADQMEKATLAAATGPIPKKIDCVSACNTRCQLASRQRMCHRACETCCARCNCVPPGTSGNHDSCRCYATLTTHGGRLKCP